MKPDQNLDEYSYEDESYEEVLLGFSYDFMASVDSDLPTNTDTTHPYADDIAYLDDLESMTDVDNDAEPPAKFKS